MFQAKKEHKSVIIKDRKVKVKQDHVFIPGPGCEEIVYLCDG